MSGFFCTRPPFKINSVQFSFSARMKYKFLGRERETLLPKECFFGGRRIFTL